MRHFLIFLALVATTSAALCQSAVAQGNGGGMIIPQWVATDADGRIDVVIVAPGVHSDILTVDRMRVSLVSQEGAVYRAEPSAESNISYSFAGVPSGVYTVVARGGELVGCYAVQVVGVEETTSREPFQIAVAEMRINKVRNSVIRYMPNTVPFVASFDAAAGQQQLAAAASSQMSRVSQTGGGLSGRILRAGLGPDGMAGAAMTNVMLYQNRELIAQAVSAEDGSFKIESLAPGPYSVIAIGPDGIAVTGFELADELLAGRSKASSLESGTETLVALQQSGAQSQLQLQLAPSGLESQAMEELLQEDESSESDVATDEGVPTEGSAVQGGAGGGGYGGGGGSGGGGGLGVILGAAAIGAAAAFGSDGDDGALSPPPVTSPLTP